MAARTRHWLRYPRTTQELRANQDRNDPLIRRRRRNLPTAYDDQIPRTQKSWKKTRKTQYREKAEGFSWHDVEFHWNSNRSNYCCPMDIPIRQIHDNLIDHLKKMGYYVITGREWYIRESLGHGLKSVCRPMRYGVTTVRWYGLPCGYDKIIRR